MMQGFPVRVAARELGRTEKAIKISDRGRPVWLPLKVVRLDIREGQLFITMPEWLAMKKGFV